MGQRLQPEIDSSACKRLAMLLRTARHERDMSQNELAERLGVHHKTVQSYETWSYRRHSVLRAERIARSLGKRLVVTLEDETP